MDRLFQDALGVLQCCVFFAAAATGGSLFEYLVHRMMHRSPFMAAAHRRHHERNATGGVLHEFLEHCRGVPVALALGALVVAFVSIASGVAFFLGATAYGAWSAYAHELQHTNPKQCFWLRMPIHYVHHNHGMWHHNFGVGTDLWDRVFGTYRRVEWLGEQERAMPDRGALDLRWI